MATAYAALVSLLNNLEVIQNHPRHSFSFENEQIQSLLETVCFLINFMESYDNSHGATKEAAQALERRIARATHAAEDVIESHVADQIHAGSTLAGKTRSRFLLDLQKAIEDMDYVKRKATKVKNSQSGFEVEQPTYSEAATSSTPLTSKKNSLVGFDDILLQLLDMLTGELSSLQVTPITGMGGIGKTTLAKHAFQHKLIVQHFDVCLWVTISQQYVAEKILLKLLSRQEKTDTETVGDLGVQLYQSLYGRRYLIVLDDMWSIEIWDEIKCFFPDTGKSSRIVVTSRQSDVASSLGSPCFTMSFLDDDKSWDLFCQKAFVEQGCPPELEEIGKKIVKKCKGLPLAIVVVAGHLGKSSRTREYWENVADQMSPALNSGEDEQVFDILSLSYSYLPIHLKSCFIYMGTFPEDDEIQMEDLLILWIAEGFLKPNQSQSLEKAAEGYLNDLIARNLILVYRWGIVDGKIQVVKIHDVLRELCLKIAEEEHFFDFLHTPRAIHRKERRVVIRMNIGKESHLGIFGALRSAPPVRWLAGEVRFDLNVFNGETRNKGNFSPVNLRYLEYSSRHNYYHDYRPCIYLPPHSVFWNLQTLIITGDFKPVIAPYDIWDMLQLRHLNVDRIYLPDPLYRDRSHQANLQILLQVQNFRLIEEVYEKIPHIKELWLKYDIMGKDCEGARSYYYPQNLGCFHELELLDCRFGNNLNWHDFVLSFTFPSSLKSLRLSDSRLDWEELTMMVGSLPHLEGIELDSDAVIGSEWTTVEGKFLRLNALVISDCNDLIYLSAESSHFPVLKTLYLNCLSKLKELPSEIGEIPTLELIILVDCTVSLAISAMRVVVEQEEQGNESIRLDVTFVYDEAEESFNRMVEEEGLRINNLYIH